MKESKQEKRGRKAEVLKIQGDWRDAMKKVISKGYAAKRKQPKTANTKKPLK